MGSVTVRSGRMILGSVLLLSEFKISKKIGMKFIVIEGIDGSGKSTQIGMLMKYLENRSIPYRHIHFPRTDAPYYGELIARFLRGDFGNIGRVDPYLVAMLYAGDRKDAAPLLKSWLDSGCILLLDRYVYSNVAFQCAKINNQKEREALRQWILSLEYEHNGIPRPDLNILLDVPSDFTRSQLKPDRKGGERGYLQGHRDIHENDLEFQRKVRETYLWQASLSDDFKIIRCAGACGSMLPPDAIFREVLAVTGF